MSNKQAKSSKARFRSLSDPETLAKFAQNLGEGIYITNEKGEILDANAAFLKIFGVATLDELKNYRVSDFVDWEARKGEGVGASSYSPQIGARGSTPSLNQSRPH